MNDTMQHDGDNGDKNSGLTPTARPIADRLDRYWFLTWTTYGTWLPGDERGFVSNVDLGDGTIIRVNQVGVEPLRNLPNLKRVAASQLNGKPVFLHEQQAHHLMNQFFETARFRQWGLQGVAIMRNPVHIVVGVPGNPEPEVLLRDFKSYGSRCLNRQFEIPKSGTWWTESGSRRKLKDDRAIATAVAYVRDQVSPLAVWISPLWLKEVGLHYDRSPAK